jgi:hypothetical protein
MDRMARAAAASPHPLGRWLRARVIRLREATRRRVFPAAVELVAPGADAGDAPVATWVHDEPPDHALRVDVLVRLLTDCRCGGLRVVSLVHVRPGPHEPGDLDLAWLAAARIAAQISGVELVTVLVLSRWGWLDLLTGAERSWARPRRRV